MKIKDTITLQINLSFNRDEFYKEFAIWLDEKQFKDFKKYLDKSDILLAASGAIKDIIDDYYGEYWDNLHGIHKAEDILKLSDEEKIEQIKYFKRRLKLLREK